MVCRVGDPNCRDPYVDFSQIGTGESAISIRSVSGCHHSPSGLNDLVFPVTNPFAQTFGANPLQPAPKVDLVEEIERCPRRVDIHTLIGLAEERSLYLTQLSRADEAKQLLHQLQVLYAETGDSDRAALTQARIDVLNGEYDSAVVQLDLIAYDDQLVAAVPEMRAEFRKVQEQLDYANRVIPQVAALELMRLRAMEQLLFEKSEWVDDWLTFESTVVEWHEYYDDLVENLNTGIDGMIAAVRDGQVASLEEAFERFPEFADISWGAALAGHEGLAFYAEPYRAIVVNGALRRGSFPRMQGNQFRGTLTSNHVDVDGLISFSQIPDQVYLANSQ